MKWWNIVFFQSMDKFFNLSSNTGLKMMKFLQGDIKNERN